MRLAYADPPYPGKAHLYPENTEVDHAELIAQLCEIMGETWMRWTAQLALPMRDTKRRPNHARNELASSHVARFA